MKYQIFNLFFSPPVAAPVSGASYSFSPVVVAVLRTAFCSFFLFFSGLHSSSAALVISNSTNTVGYTNATVWGNLVSTNTTNPAVWLFYGRTDGGTNASSWGYSNGLGTCATGMVSLTRTNLLPATWYYYRWYAYESTNTNGSAWASGSTNFTTTARPPTNWPAASNSFGVTASSNGNLTSPANFWDANGVVRTNTPGYTTTVALAAAALPKAGGVMTGPVTNETGYYGNGKGLTNIPVAGVVGAATGTPVYTESDPVASPMCVGISNAFIAADAGISNNLLSKAGGVMTGPVTNEIGYYGNGKGLTNIPVAGVVGAATGTPVYAEVDPNWAAQSSAVVQAKGAVEEKSNDWNTVTLSMTNFVAVDSSNNWLAYNPATRIFSGCISNAATSESGTNWSQYPALKDIDANDKNMTNIVGILAKYATDFLTDSKSWVVRALGTNVAYFSSTSIEFEKPVTANTLICTNGANITKGSLNLGGGPVTNADYVQTTGTTTKAISVTCPNGTTNAGNLVVTGAGFKPKGATVLAAGVEIPGIEGSPFSSAVVDSAGNDYGICTYCAAASQGMYSFNGSAKIYWLAGVDSYNILDWVSWDADGATFSRTISGTPTTNTVVYQFLFYR